MNMRSWVCVSVWVIYPLGAVTPPCSFALSRSSIQRPPEPHPAAALPATLEFIRYSRKRTNRFLSSGFVRASAQVSSPGKWRGSISPDSCMSCKKLARRAMWRLLPIDAASEATATGMKLEDRELRPLPHACMQAERR